MDVPVPDSSDAPTPAPLDRRDFLRVAGIGAGTLLATGCVSAAGAGGAFAAVPPGQGIPRRPARNRDTGHVVVIGAGAWGAWTAYHLRQQGARVTMIDAYGAANSRATSGDETRGIRSSYGDRAAGTLWTPWARTAIARWKAFDEEWGPRFHTRFFYTTGDVILRPTQEPFLTKTVELWRANNVPHEVLTGDEVRKRWPVIKADDITTAIYEPDAGVARARASTQAIAAIAQDQGARLIISRVTPGAIANGRMDGVTLEDGTVVRGEAYVFACGPWLRKLFPYLTPRMRVPIGVACYFGTPVADQRFTVGQLPSWNVPGVTGWPVLPTDSRGFRVRGSLAPTGAAANAPRPAPPPADPAQQDPDTSSRWATQATLDGARRVLEVRFPLLATMPLLETRACHYESSINANFIIDHVPDTGNAWIAGVGQAEGFKFAPVVSEYVAQRVLGDPGDPALRTAFALPTTQYGGD
jgi:glycine/D-amino acid oxidase-like deaminating enzyme